MKDRRRAGSQRRTMPKHSNVAQLLPHQIRHTELSDGRLPCLPATQFVPFYFLNTNLSQITQITQVYTSNPVLIHLISPLPSSPLKQ